MPLQVGKAHRLPYPLTRAPHITNDTEANVNVRFAFEP